MFMLEDVRRMFIHLAHPERDFLVDRRVMIDEQTLNMLEHVRRSTLKMSEYVGRMCDSPGTRAGKFSGQSPRNDRSTTAKKVTVMVCRSDTKDVRRMFIQRGVTDIVSVE